ncbi:heavy metal-associated domain-containing protein [uncultured Algoriphagus sp.]|uniref:heavy-metal-associated domain-containing protein n=1 Tax=uncultured Algoriphagus sp. TaxID=417365 RepID=UPI0030EC4815|tara:strand:+ start:6026 stop:6358 length:333 start_codon:yes stop_codon:yes gene_type:complete
MKIAVNFSLLLMIVILLGCAENPKKSSHADVNQADNVFVEVSIEGMSCMACVAKVKKTLSDLNGIYEVKVSLENKNATIQYNPNNIALDKIKQAIDEIGYNAGAVKTLSQ